MSDEEDVADAHVVLVVQVRRYVGLEEHVHVLDARQSGIERRRVRLLVLDVYVVEGDGAVRLEERRVHVRVEVDGRLVGDLLHAVVGGDDQIELVVEVVRAQLLDEIGESGVEFGELGGHLGRVGAVDVTRVVRLVEVESAEVDGRWRWRRRSVVSAAAREHADEEVDEVVEARRLIVGHGRDRLVGEDGVGAHPVGGAAASVARQLIARPDGLDELSILAEPVDERRVGAGPDLERAIERSVVHRVGHNAVRLLVNARYHRPVVGKRGRRELADRVVRVRAVAFERLERAQVVHLQVVVTKAVELRREETKNKSNEDNDTSDA